MAFPMLRVLVLMLVRGGRADFRSGRRVPKDVQDRLAEQSSLTSPWKVANEYRVIWNAHTKA